MRYVLRWWETLGRPERIVAMSLAAGSVVAITNSTVWAVAVSYMAHQKTRVALAAQANANQPGAATAPQLPAPPATALESRLTARSSSPVATR
jgi:hypothetical protein